MVTWPTQTHVMSIWVMRKGYILSLIPNLQNLSILNLALNKDKLNVPNQTHAMTQILMMNLPLVRMKK